MPSENLADDGEDYDAQWVSIEGLLETLTFEEDRELVRRAVEVVEKPGL